MTLSYWIVVALLILFYVWIFRGGRMIDRMLTDYYKRKAREEKAAKLADDD